MKVILASDHAGFALKEAVRQFLITAQIEVDDVGAHEFDDTDDYPVYIKTAMEHLEDAIANEEEVRAIVFGKSGQGEAMAANKYALVRAAVFYGGSDDIITLAREHNDSNVLALAGGFLTSDQALHAVALWLETPFSGEERHFRRNQALSELTDRHW